MTDQPLVSVVVPVHNGVSFLAAALHSVLAQTLADLELIVVDDGSVDGSAAVVRRSTDSRVHLVQQVHQGAGAARNRGVAESHAPCLAFLDADDVWLPHKLALQVAALDGDTAPDMIFGHYLQFIDTEAGIPLEDRPPRPGYSCGTLLIRRPAIRRAGPFATTWRVGEFIEWYARAVDAGLTSHMLPEVVLRRRVHAANGTRRAARSDYARVAAAIVRRRRAGGTFPA